MLINIPINLRAAAVCSNQEQAVRILKYVLEGSFKIISNG